MAKLHQNWPVSSVIIHNLYIHKSCTDDRVHGIQYMPNDRMITTHTVSSSSVADAATVTQFLLHFCIIVYGTSPNMCADARTRARKLDMMCGNVN